MRCRLECKHCTRAIASVFAQNRALIQILVKIVTNITGLVSRYVNDLEIKVGEARTVLEAVCLAGSCRIGLILNTLSKC